MHTKLMIVRMHYQIKRTSYLPQSYRIKFQIQIYTK